MLDANARFKLMGSSFTKIGIGSLPHPSGGVELVLIYATNIRIKDNGAEEPEYPPGGIYGNLTDPGDE